MSEEMENNKRKTMKIWYWENRGEQKKRMGEGIALRHSVLLRGKYPCVLYISSPALTAIRNINKKMYYVLCNSKFWFSNFSLFIIGIQSVLNQFNNNFFNPLKLKRIYFESPNHHLHARFLQIRRWKIPVFYTSRSLADHVYLKYVFKTDHFRLRNIYLAYMWFVLLTFYCICICGHARSRHQARNLHL